MPSRNHHVVVSEDEKRALDDTAEAMFGTKNVPPGAVISALTNDYLDDN